MSSLIEAAEISELVNSLIVDCRYDLKNLDAGRISYNEGHIPGALYADLLTDLSGPLGTTSGRHPLPEISHLEKLFSRWGLTPETNVVCYDAQDMAFASRLWWLLRYCGHERVQVLNGGLQAWIKSGGKLDQSVMTRKPSVFKAHPQKEMLVEANDVLNQKLLVDSRDPARYRGEVEPIDKVAGHIPGSLNLFYKNHLDENSKLKTASELSKNFAQLISNETPTFYCGSGVTACMNVLASVQSGRSMPRLYAGSWSEWITDPSRPIKKI